MSQRLLPVDPEEAVIRLQGLQARITQHLRAGAARPDRHGPSRLTSADTVYALDEEVEPLIESFCRDWAEKVPLVLICEGLEGGVREGVKVFPAEMPEDEALIRLIIDPIDGTRGLMYDKRSAWSLASVAPNLGPGTALRDLVASVMTELPTSRMGYADTYSAIRGRGVRGRRLDLRDGTHEPLAVHPSTADSIDHGFASVSSFFPGTKVPAARLMELIAQRLIRPEDLGRATVFEDQYISTAGQWHELFAGHDRFNADLRPAFYRLQGQPVGMSCHPYDCAALVIAEEAGVILTDERGQPLDAPLDVTSSINWVGYANQSLRRKIEPIIREFLDESGDR